MTILREQGQLFNAVDLSSSQTSTGMMLDNVKAISIQSVFSGAPNGTIKIQCCNDLTDDPSLVVNWQDYDAASQTVVAAGNVMWEFDPIRVKWIRLVYTRASGSGALSSNFYSVVGA